MDPDAFRFRPAAWTPVLWRCAVVAAIPLGLWAWNRAVWETVPDAAADLGYQVRVNRITGAACLHFEGEAPPKRLRAHAC